MAHRSPYRWGRRWLDQRRPHGPPPAGERRADGHDVSEDDQPRRSLLRRTRALAARYRAPLIGLTMAGAATPMLRSGDVPRKPPKTATDRAEKAARPGAAVADELAARWARLHDERTRQDTIEGAQLRYGIDRGLAADIYDAAVDEGIEPDIAYGLVNTESTFRHRAVSHVGARGLTQLMPNTARALMPGITNEDLFERRLNLTLGFRYLNEMIDKYNGNVRLALLAYNRGPGTVDGILARGGDPDNGYADRVLRG